MEQHEEARWHDDGGAVTAERINKVPAFETLMGQLSVAARQQLRYDLYVYGDAFLNFRRRPDGTYQSTLIHPLEVLLQRRGSPSKTPRPAVSLQPILNQQALEDCIEFGKREAGE